MAPTHRTHPSQQEPEEVAAEEPVLETDPDVTPSPEAEEPAPGSVCTYCPNEPFWETKSPNASPIYMCPDHRGMVTTEAVDLIEGKTPPETPGPPQP